MLGNLNLTMTLGPLALFVFVLEMVRRRRLREDFSLLWLATFGLMIGLSLSRGVLDQLAEWMGIFYPPTALFVIGFGLVLLVLIQFSSIITRMARQNQQAAQHIALLSSRVRELELRLNSHGEDAQ